MTQLNLIFLDIQTRNLLFEYFCQRWHIWRKRRKKNLIRNSKKSLSISPSFPPIMKKTMRKLWRFQRWIERKEWKEKRKKKEALKQRRVHFQTSLTRFHVYREINPDEAGNSAPAQRQRRSMSRFFTEAVSMSFLFFCGPKARFGSMTSRGNLFPSVRPFDPSLPLPVFAVQSVFSSSPSPHESFETPFNYRTARRVGKPGSFFLVHFSIRHVIDEGSSITRALFANRSS